MIYTSATENPRSIVEICSRYMDLGNIHVAACVVGGYPWPCLFQQEITPQANILSFDRNKEQIDYWGGQIENVTGNYPVCLSVNERAFDNWLLENQVQLLHLSNIPDFQLFGSALAKYLSNLGLQAIVYSSRGQTNTEDFARTLGKAGYHLLTIEDRNSGYDIYKHYCSAL